jgi:hypothetical protein
MLESNVFFLFLLFYLVNIYFHIFLLFYGPAYMFSSIQICVAYFTFQYNNLSITISFIFIHFNCLVPFIYFKYVIFGIIKSFLLNCFPYNIFLNIFSFIFFIYYIFGSYILYYQLYYFWILLDNVNNDLDLKILLPYILDHHYFFLYV